jgi:hypothetical protein
MNFLFLRYSHLFIIAHFLLYIHFHVSKIIFTKDLERKCSGVNTFWSKNIMLHRNNSVVHIWMNCARNVSLRSYNENIHRGAESAVKIKIPPSVKIN